MVTSGQSPQPDKVQHSARVSFTSHSTGLIAENQQIFTEWLMESVGVPPLAYM